jgi:hypothetical protein
VRPAGLLVLLVLLVQGACSDRPAPDAVEVAVWGSSSAQRLVEQGGLAATLGVDVYDGGVGGELSSVIAARQGGAPAMLQVVGGVIPASGTVRVRNLTFGPRPGIAIDGTLGGVPGALRSSGQGDVFVRRSPGAEVPLPGPAPLVSDASVGHRGAVTLLWMGKNDVTQRRWAKADAGTRAAWAYAQAHSGKVLVLGHFADAGMVPGSPEREGFDRLQEAYAAEYGADFVDVEAYVCSPQVWTDTAVRPTDTDLAAQRAGTLPPSLDDGQGQHLSPAGYRAVGERLVRPRLLQRGWLG